MPMILGETSWMFINNIRTTALMPWMLFVHWCLFVLWAIKWMLLKWVLVGETVNC